MVQVQWGEFGPPLNAQFACQMWTQSYTPTSNDSVHFDRLSKDDCFARYNVALQSNFSNLILVTDDTAGQYVILPEQQDLHHGTNLSISPYTGNAVLVLNSSQHWTYPLLVQNTSGGIYLDESDYLWSIPTLRTAFSSFDYRYWMMAGEVGYDFNNSKVSGAAQWDPVTWMCDTSTVMSGGSCASSSTSNAPADWKVTPKNFSVDHCLSQSAPEQCTLEYSFIILLIVIGCDILKLAAMVSTLLWVAEQPLATMGDSIASFLEKPDSFTLGRCLLQQQDVRRTARILRSKRTSLSPPAYDNLHGSDAHRGEMLGPNTVFWTRQVTRWYSAPSRRRWMAFGIL